MSGASIDLVQTGVGYRMPQIPGEGTNRVVDLPVEETQKRDTDCGLFPEFPRSVFCVVKDLNAVPIVSAEETSDSRPHVTIIDGFEQREIAVNSGDTDPDISHGRLVELCVLSQLPDAQIERVEIYGRGSGAEATVIAETLEGILATQSQQQGVAIDKVDLSNQYVNISWAAQRLSDGERSRLVTAVEAFTERGGKIYVAAGNDYPNALNKISGVISVDGSSGLVGENPDSTPSDIYENGEGHDAVANSVVTFVPVVDQDGEIVGYDMNGDRRPDILAKEIAPARETHLVGAKLKSDNVVAAEEIVQIENEFNAWAMSLNDSVQWDSMTQDQIDAKNAALAKTVSAERERLVNSFDEKKLVSVADLLQQHAELDESIFLSGLYVSGLNLQHVY